MQYKLIENKAYSGKFAGSILSRSICRLSDSACVPLDPANTDYRQFKQDVLDGAELQDADGNTMTKEEAINFIGTLP